MSAGQTGGERECSCGSGTLATWHSGACALTKPRPVPVAGQAAREAAVEAVARWLWLSTCKRSPQVWPSVGVALDVARELLDDPAVLAALSAAPGQEQGR